MLDIPKRKEKVGDYCPKFMVEIQARYYQIISILVYSVAMRIYISFIVQYRIYSG